MRTAATAASDPHLLLAFGASLVLHSALLLAAPLLERSQHPASAAISVQLMEISAVPDRELAADAPKPEPKKKEITAPKLLAKSRIIAPQSSPAAGISKDRLTESIEPKPEPSPLVPPDRGPTSGELQADIKPGKAEGVSAGDGKPSVIGDLAAGIGTDRIGGAGDGGIDGAGRGAKGDDSRGSGEALSTFARPAGGHQVKPHYPESARRAGVQGTTLLKLQVLASGKVGEILIEKSAGHRDLDRASIEAVKKWLFEPARAGNIAVAVWVLLPVKFELE
jgi:protein TonB